MAAALGITVQAFDNRYRPLIPDEFVTKEGRRVWFGRGVVSAIIDFERRGGDLDEDGLFSGGGSSPALERGREIKAKILAIELKERLGRLIEIGDAERILSITASRIRGAGDKLARKFGGDAAEILNDALVEAEKEIEDALGVTGKAN